MKILSFLRWKWHVSLMKMYFLECKCDIFLDDVFLFCETSPISRGVVQGWIKTGILKQIVLWWWTAVMQMMERTRVAEVAREHGWHPPKSLDSDENFKPEHTLFCCELRIVAIYAFFGDLWAKKGPFWVKNSVSWARSALLHGIYIYCIKTAHLSRKL